MSSREKDVPGTRAKLTRRSVLQAAPSAAALLFPTTGWARQSAITAPGSPQGTAPHFSILMQPDLMSVLAGDVDAERYSLLREGSGWNGAKRAAGVRVSFVAGEQQSEILLDAPALPVQRLHLRWKLRLGEACVVLGDAWERSYGDLEWRSLQAERVLPWYAVVSANGHSSGMGVKTGASSFAFWQVDSEGISLWLDVRNGGNGLLLGQRTLQAATIVECHGASGESAYMVTQRLCHAMAAGTKVPARRGDMPLDAIYGSNDWYYAYGHNKHDGILRDADLVRSLAPAGAIKPFTVIDDGYQDTSRFPNLSNLAEEIRRRGVIPGIWVRPLRASGAAPRTLLLPDSRWNGPANEQAPPAYDPTIPEGLQAIAAVAEEACGWGFDLIKHDFTTYELLGQWGSQMGASPTMGNWHFNDRTVTNAEVVGNLYRKIRASCGGDRIILGCNTVGHLSVGIFDASRTGDDVSGKQWERTRRTGVNTLAFRLPQHKVFYSVDADCVAITPEIPWAMTRQWLQVIANSGSVLLISPDPRSVGAKEKEAIRSAFARCVHRPGSEPQDWMESRSPASWRSGAANERYQWILEDGESPFPIGIQRGPE